MTTFMDYARSRLVRRLLGRIAIFTLLAFLLLAAMELWLERAHERDASHARAVQATEQALASIEHAVWTYDEPNLRLAVLGLLRERSIASVRIDTPEPSMRLRLERPDEPRVAPNDTWSRPLESPGGRHESLGRVVVGETFRDVDAATLARATYRLPLELLKVLGIVVGLTLVTQGMVVARVNALARQLRALEGDGALGRIHDDGGDRCADDEIGRLTAVLNQSLAQREATRASELARGRAEASNQAKTELISRISHELRTPLNAIVGFAHALQGDPAVAGDATRAERVNLIGKAGKHLAALIGELLDYARMERGDQRVDLRPVVLEPICRDALALVESDAREAGVTLAFRTSEPSLWASADPVRLEQVVLNLLSNAIKYNQRGGRVTLTLSPAANARVVVEVVDNGLGMSEEQLAKLYQPFNRLGREASTMPGTGIGLVITRRLVELMQGSMDVASSCESGTRFTIHLRACPAEIAPPAPESPGVAAAPSALASGTVLYVEDDPVNVEVMRAVLAARPDVRLQVATRVDDALAAIALEPPRLVLLDMHLPDGTGTDVLRALRAQPRFAALPVIVVSADAQEQGVAMAQAAGADGYIAKPIDFSELLARVDHHLAGAPAPVDPLVSRA